jgi:predicted RNase H-like nuclease
MRDSIAPPHRPPGREKSRVEPNAWKSLESFISPVLSETLSGVATVVAGVDGTKGGWVAVVLVDGRVQRTALLRPVGTDFSELADATVIGIDVPIGFGPRRADSAARTYLSGAASTVFTTPSREVLEAPFGPGLGVSAQAHNLGERVLHVTDLAKSDPRLREVHPEVSFRAMNGGEALRFRKKSAGGAFERLDLLRRQVIELGDFGAAASAPLDDVLDAAAAAWTALRLATGTAKSLPSPPERIDDYDVAIWF